MLVLVDREVDMVTPLCTQLTYEGLLDEVLGIRNGTVSIDQSGAFCRAATTVTNLKHNSTALSDYFSWEISGSAQLLKSLQEDTA